MARGPKQHVDNFVDNTVAPQPESLILINRVAQQPKIKEKISFVIKRLQIPS
jgi:hypothetical protein